MHELPSRVRELPILVPSGRFIIAPHEKQGRHRHHPRILKRRSKDLEVKSGNTSTH
jgi:hypothetical protein